MCFFALSSTNFEPQLHATAMTTEGSLEEYAGYNKSAMVQESVLDFYSSNADTYELGMMADEYNGPQLALPFCTAYFDKSSRVLEVGAGTGQLGKMLSIDGFTDLHAIDPCTEMLEIARTREVYNSITNDFLDPIRYGGLPPRSFDGLISVGAYGPGMMGPDVFPIFIDMVKPGGKIVFGTREAWMHDQSSGDYPHWPHDSYQIIRDLEVAGQWRSVTKALVPNHCLGHPGFYMVMEVL